MSQTFPGLAATDFWSLFRTSMPHDRTASCEAAPSSEDEPEESERASLPEHGEGFHWGVGRFGHW